MVDAERLVIEAINAVKGSGFAVADVPAARPPQFVTVERTGGSENLHTGSPVLAVQCWSTTRHQASKLAEAVSDILKEMVIHPNIGRVAISSFYNFPDPDSKQARYQIVLQFVTKG